MAGSGKMDRVTLYGFDFYRDVLCFYFAVIDDLEN